jgi:hypothetical protein
MVNQLVLTPPHEWRKESEGELCRLPSGRVARLRGVQFDFFVMTGKIMDSLTPIIAAIMEGKKDIEAMLPDKIADLQQYIDILNAVCRCAFVEPQIVDPPISDNQISINDLLFEDKEFVYHLLGIATRDLEPFRRQQEGYVDSVVSPEGHVPASEPPAEPARVGDGEDGAGRVVDGVPV